MSVSGFGPYIDVCNVGEAPHCELAFSHMCIPDAVDTCSPVKVITNIR